MQWFAPWAACGIALAWPLRLLLCLAAGSPAPPPAAHPQPGEVRGIWIHTYNPVDWDRVARKVSEAGFNSIFVRVGRGGNVIYPSRLLPRDAWAEQAGGDELQRAIDAAHRYGLDFHAWRVCFHMRSAPKAYYERMAAQDRLVRDAEGKQSFWANPGDPRNSDLELQAVLELVRRYNVDGVQLDYIRYPDEPHYDFDYGPVSRARFEKALGRRVAEWPQDVIAGPLKRAYEDWERGNVDCLVERVYRGVKRLKPQVQVSAAVWRAHRRYRAAIKQDWPLWVERGWLDFVVPMDYTEDNRTFAETVKAQVAVVGGRIPMVAGIGTWLQPTVERVVEQVQLARQAGASGCVLFAYNDDRIEKILDALAGSLRPQRALPAYRTPRFAFALGDEVRARKDAPHAVEAGQAFRVAVKLRTTSGTRRAPVDAQAVIEDAGGRVLAAIGRLSSKRPALSAEVIAPAGMCQVVVHGTQGGREFAVRGPLLEGLAADAMAALRAEDAPPHPEGDGRRVGVYAGGLGAEATLAALKGDPRLSAFLVHRLRPDHLAAAEVLILPQLRDVAELSAEAEGTLRRWVEGGGRLLLIHDAVGFRWHPAPFPEVGRGLALASKRPVRATLPGQPEWTLEYAYRDHVRILPGPSATVLARESGPEGAPVVASGDVGKGRVTLVGIIPGVQGDGSLTPGELRLLQALIEP